MGSDLGPCCDLAKEVLYHSQKDLDSKGWQVNCRDLLHVPKHLSKLGNSHDCYGVRGGFFKHLFSRLGTNDTNNACRASVSAPGSRV